MLTDFQRESARTVGKAGNIIEGSSGKGLGSATVSGEGIILFTRVGSNSIRNVGMGSTNGTVEKYTRAGFGTTSLTVREC